MAALADAGYTGMSVPRWLDVRASLSGGLKPVVITFDDGFRGNPEIAIPALQELGWTGTFFVISGKMDCDAYGSAADWRQAAKAGMDIASHTATHPFAGTLSLSDLRRELLDSRSALEDAIGGPVTGLSWPNGDAPRGGRGLLLECGYSWAATSRAAFAGSATDPFSLPRLAVRSWHDPDALSKLLDTSLAHRLRMLGVYRTKALARALLGRRRYSGLQMKVTGDA
jgi:peptidoglycan/xylan/chitin deacetylase (PgdA/CDA1 family)